MWSKTDTPKLTREFAVRSYFTTATILAHLNQIGKVKKFDKNRQGMISHELNDHQNKSVPKFLHLCCHDIRLNHLHNVLLGVMKNNFLLTVVNVRQNGSIKTNFGLPKSSKDFMLLYSYKKICT